MRTDGFFARQQWGEYPPLRGPHTADAVIVGGGFTGITTALWLCRAGLRVTLLEAETLACGSSARCAGMLSLTGRIMLEKLERQRGVEAAGAYVRSQLAAFGAIRSMALEAEDGLGWQDADARILAAGKADRLSAEADALRRAGAAAEAGAATHAPLPAAGEMVIRNMACLDPMRYFYRLTLEAVLSGLIIHEHSRVIALETNMAQTADGVVKAPFVVLATGYPLVNVPGWYFLRLRQRRRCLVALPDSAGAEGMFFDGGGRYALRPLQDGMLLQLDCGGVGFRPGEDGLACYKRRLAPWLGNAATVYEGVETFSADGLPYIGPYSRKTPNLFVACGYGGSGLLGSMTAAQLISARVLGLAADSAWVFSGQRSGNSVLAQEAASAAGVAWRYMLGWLRPFAPRCPHMGCKLVYSPARRLWECPCHGSRFDSIGHLLNAPAAEDADIRRRL